MNEGQETLRDLIIGIMIFMLLFIIAGLILLKNPLSFVFGVMLGSLTAVLLAFHLYKSIFKALDLPPEASMKFTKRKAFLRLLVMGLALIIALTIPEVFHPAGVIFGIIGLKFAAFIQPVTNKYISNKIPRRGR